jgi:AcrR family transcriptional regulator
MKSEKQDRRSERTRRMIGEALVSLMMERSFAQLTVQDILDHANIGRSTFYSHYFDKEDLLASEIARIVNVLTRRLDAAPVSSRTLLPSLELFQHIHGHYRLYQALEHGQGFALVLQTLRQRLCAQVEERLIACGGCDRITIAVTAQGIVGMLLALLQWWLETGMTLSPERLEAEYQRLIMPGISAMIEK